MQRNHGPWVATALFAVAVLAGCGNSGGTSAIEPDVSDAPTSDAPAGSAPAVGDVPPDMLEGVIADAASGAGVDPSDVEVITAEAVTWPDGALGCPQPDQMYTQALAPGYRVVVEIDGEELHFHASESGEFAFCADPQPPVDAGADDR